MYAKQVKGYIKGTLLRTLENHLKQEQISESAYVRNL